MKRHILLLLFAAAFCFASVLHAQSPGSVSDPLITKSYVEHFLRFNSFLLKAKDSILPEFGALIVVKSGKVVLNSPNGKNLIDLTSGKEISSGKALPLLHLILVPENGVCKLVARKNSVILASYFSEQLNSGQQ